MSDQLSIENILLDTVAPLLEKTMNAEMDEHLGYNKHQKRNFEIQEMDILLKIFKVFLEKQELKHLMTDIVLLNP